MPLKSDFGPEFLMSELLSEPQGKCRIYKAGMVVILSMCPGAFSGVEAGFLL
jgi:hypothetical protein